MNKHALLKIFGLASLMLFFAVTVPSQELKTSKLNAPDKNRGLPFMQSLSVRASATQWSDRELSLQDLSDLLWAANGINRPDSGKRTASSAMNAQDVDIYVFVKDGVYLYDAKEHALNPVVAGDARAGHGPTPRGALRVRKPPNRPRDRLRSRSCSSWCPTYRGSAAAARS